MFLHYRSTGLPTVLFFSIGLLKFEDGSTQWPAGAASMVYSNRLRLPTGLTCSQCVLQWYYKASE